MMKRGLIADYLVLLGFHSPGDGREAFLNGGLFNFPDHKAFQQVIHFLLQTLDGDRCASSFRFCWPASDQKMAADFRKIAFDWYSELQKENAKRLPAVTFSKFLSPGGRRFQAFLAEFLRFVASVRLRRGDATFLDAAAPDSRLASALKVMTAENMTEARTECRTAADSYDDGQRLVASLAAKYEEVRREAEEMDLREAQFLRDIREMVPQGDADEECASMKAALERTVAAIGRFHEETGDAFKTIADVVASGDLKLDLSLAPRAASSSVVDSVPKAVTMSQALEKLISGATAGLSCPTIDFPDVGETSALIVGRRNFWRRKERELRWENARLEESVDGLEGRILPGFAVEWADLFPPPPSIHATTTTTVVLEGVWRLPFVLEGLPTHRRSPDDATPAKSEDVSAFALSPWVYREAEEDYRPPAVERLLLSKDRNKCSHNYDKMSELMSTLCSPAETSSFELDLVDDD